jgi:uncharacterized protein (UPF0333 family)
MGDLSTMNTFSVVFVVVLLGLSVAVIYYGQKVERDSKRRPASIAEEFEKEALRIERLK